MFINKLKMHAVRMYAVRYRGVRNGDRGLHENLDPTSKLVIPFSERNSKGLPDFTVHCI